MLVLLVLEEAKVVQKEFSSYILPSSVLGMSVSVLDALDMSFLGHISAVLELELELV